ncbi:hypothetical protein ACQJBY_008012 [Aegilops geniculata]
MLLLEAAVLLTSHMLLLLLAVLYAWSRAPRLLGRPAPPIPDLQPADELSALIHSGLASSFRHVAQGQASSGRVFLWPGHGQAGSGRVLGRLARDLPPPYATQIGRS